MDYAVPQSDQVPLVETVLVEVPSDHGPFGAKGVGEPPVIAAPAAIANAVADATGLRFTDLPISTEAVASQLRRRSPGPETPVIRYRLRAASARALRRRSPGGPALGGCRLRPDVVTWGVCVTQVMRQEPYRSARRVQRKVLTPNDFRSLAAVKDRLLRFQARYEATATPFQWTVGTRKDPLALRMRLKLIPEDLLRRGAAEFPRR